MHLLHASLVRESCEKILGKVDSTRVRERQRT